MEISLVKYDELVERQEHFFQLFGRLPVNRLRVHSVINFFGENEDPILDKNIQRPYKEWPTCKVPFRSFNINWDGDVTPCVIDYDCKYSIGNVYDERILDVWNGERMRHFRKCHIEKRFDLIKSKNGRFCDYCSNLWVSPNDHGPQYPETFEQGVRDFFEQNKTQAGRFESDVFKSEVEVHQQYKDFVADYDRLYEEITGKTR